MKLYKVCILFTCLFMKRHDKHLHTSPLTIPFLIKSSSSSPAHRLGRPLHPSPWTQSRGGTSTGTQSERERVCPLSMPSRRTCSLPSCSDTIPQCLQQRERQDGKKQGCRIYLKRSGEHVSKAGWDLVFLSLSVCPFCYHSVETWEAGQALQSEHRGSPPGSDFHRAEWEACSMRACARLMQDLLSLSAHRRRLSHSSCGPLREQVGDCSGLDWSESSGKPQRAELHNGAAWTHVVTLSSRHKTSVSSSTGGKHNWTCAWVWHTSDIGNSQLDECQWQLKSVQPPLTLTGATLN